MGGRHHGPIFFGPADKTLRLAATDEGGGGIYSRDQLILEWDADGNMVFVDGPAARPRGLKVVAMGDSITARANSVTTQFFTQASVGWLSWARVLTGQRFYSPPSYNFGINGYTAGGVFRDQLPLALAVAPDIAIIMVGTNDVANGTTAATVIDYLTQTYDALQKAGVTVIAIPILGRGDGLLSAAEAKEAMRVNEFIRQCGFSRRNFYVADCGAVFDDPTTTTWQDRAGLCDDRLHPNNMGAYLIGCVVADVLDDIAPGRARIPVSNGADVYDATANPAGNLIGTSGLMVGTGGATSGGGSGEVATGWTFVGSVLGGATAVCAKDSFPDGRVAQKLTLSGAYSGTARLAQFQIAITAGQFAAGDVIEAECEFEMNAPTNLISADLYFQSTEAAVAYQHSSLRGATVAHTAGHRGVLRTYPRVMTAVPSSVALVFQIQFVTPQAGSSPIAGAIKFGSVAIRKVQ